MSQGVSVDGVIKNIVRSGRVVIGSRRSLRLLRIGGLRAVIVAEKSVRSIVSDAMRYARLGGVPLILFRGSSMDLGNLIGKPFPVTLIGVIDPGDVSMDIINEVAIK